MAWNYRIVDYGSHVGVHEVYYRKDGSVEGVTFQPRALTGDSIDDIEEDLRLILSDLRRFPPIPHNEFDL